jgi:ligand-binding sensor domain-containing protein
MRIRFIVFVITVFFFHSTSAQFQHIAYPYIKNYTTKDYNGQPDNFAGIEDNRGFLFFGNLWGILEFDGNSWRNIIFPNGSSGISFAKNEKGVIYCGGRGVFGFLEPDSLGFLQFTSLTHLLKKKINFRDVWSTYSINSSIIFCSNEALFILKNQSITTIETKTSYGRAFVAHGKIYVQEEGIGLCELVNNKLVLTKGGDFFTHIEASVILPYKEGKIIVGNNKNFYLVSENKTIPWNTTIVDYLKGTKLFTAIALNDSNYLLATNTKGIIIIDNNGKIKNIINKSSGLISNNILNSFLDSNGNIWVLSRGGISKIEFNGCFNYINEFHGITGLNYSACIFNNTLYLGTSEGLYFKKIVTNNQEQSINSNFQMFPSTEGNVWTLKQFGEELFCGHNEGVFIIHNNYSYQISGTKGVWCFLQPKGFNNIILAGTYSGIIILEKKNRIWSFRGYVKGFNESSRFLVQDAMEEFWVSHGNKGVFKLSLSHNLDSVLKIKPYSQNEGLWSNYNNTVYSHNNEVIISNNHGFYKYNIQTDRMTLWGEFNATLNKFRSTQRFVVESNKSFWVILSDEKIIHITKINNDSFKTDISIRKFNKRLAGSFEHILPINENLTLIATLDGFAFFNKEKYNKIIELNKQNFKAFIRKTELTRDTIATIYAGETIKTNNKPIIPEIKYKQNSIRFSFSSNCFEDIEHTQFQFILKGFDNLWSPWSASFQKEYTNLPPGRYKFIVRAQNSYNIIGKEDSFDFIILPPWYKSIYAYSLYVIALLLSFLGIYKYILFRFKLQKKRLDLKKERELWSLNKKHIEEQIQKENEILKLNNEKLSAEIANLEQIELLRKKDEQLKEEFDKAKQEQIQHEQEKHSLEITHKNKELSIMAMQIAHKSESISKIRDYLISFTENNDSPDFKAMANHLFEYIDKDIQHDKEWKEFQEYFDMVHSSFTNKLKATYPSISPTLLKLSTYLRVKMSNKQIARLMNTTVESVLKSRYRLREKLQLNTDDNLDDFIEKF